MEIGVLDKAYACQNSRESLVVFTGESILAEPWSKVS